MSRPTIEYRREAAKLLTTLLFLGLTSVADAHVAEQALVMLLPTDVYISVGTGVVIASALVLALLPTTQRVPSTLVREEWPPVGSFSTVASVGATAVLGLLVLFGLFGTRDPLANPLPLAVWTVWWIVIVSLHGLFGYFWRHINPFSGLHNVWCVHYQHSPLHDGIARWPACVVLLLFSAFVLADPAPDDPERLAILVCVLWVIWMLGLHQFGESNWFTRVDALSMLMQRFASLSPINRNENGRLSIALPGLALTFPVRHARSNAVFCVLLLGIGSYDGLNETFWWLAHIDVNPLEYPGRSALIRATVLGLLLANLALLAVFAAVVILGARLAGPIGGTRVGVGTLFDRLAPTLVPIAFGYHIAHYLTTFLVNGQYTLVAISDPLGSGRDLLGLGHHFVSTGLFNTPGSVRTIWLTQAAAVTIGHMLSLLLAHRVAEELFATRRQVIISQIPVVAFMCLYTGFGLWLLAAPRGA